MAAGAEFDPRTLLGALERHYVDYVLIGGLARVLRGTGELTHGVDICPSFSPTNLKHLADALRELNARRGRSAVNVDEELITSDPPSALLTDAGPLRIVGAPAGAPNGFVDLRRGATKEALGQGLRPLVASTPDLARMAAALESDQDPQRLRQLRRIIELETQRPLTPPSATPSAINRQPVTRTRSTRQ
jgi:hypothetical protein